MAELRGVGIDQPNHLRCFFGINSLIQDRYHFEPKLAKDQMSGFIRLSLGVIWRFINLNSVFNNVFNKTSRSVFVYSDVSSSSVVGNQVTDILCEVNYRGEGKGSQSFEPLHMNIYSST